MHVSYIFRYIHVIALFALVFYCHRPVSIMDAGTLHSCNDFPVLQIQLVVLMMVALRDRHMKPTLRNISLDSRCDVHQTVLGIREGKEGWFDLYCPGGVACDDDGELYSVMVCTELLLL